MSENPGSTENHRPDFHIVEINETLGEIAKKYSLSTKQLQSWNRLSESALIFPGMRINLNPSAEISTETALLTVIPAGPPQFDKKQSSACLVHGFHRLRQGESISKIAAVYGIPTHKLLEANGLAWNSPVFIGQKIVLPGVHDMHNCPDFKPLQRSYRDVAARLVKIGTRKPMADERIVAALSRIYELHALPEANHESDFELLLESTDNPDFLVSAWVWFQQIKVELADG